MQPRQEDEVFIRLFEDHRLVAVVDPSTRVARFLESEFGARYLGRGAVELSLKILLPAKTHLVTVPTNSTAISIAARVVRYCNAEGDAGQKNSETIVVKVGRQIGASPFSGDEALEL